MARINSLKCSKGDEEWLGDAQDVKWSAKKPDENGALSTLQANVACRRVYLCQIGMLLPFLVVLYNTMLCDL